MKAPLAIVSDPAELRARVMAARSSGRSVGFAPTMGALHAGHASLVRAARAENDLVVASIFVNPLQFAPHEDLAAYPRTFDADCALLAAEGTEILFAPRPEHLYPQGFATLVTMSGLTEVLCGRSRPTHFAGVLTVVLKLLHVAVPHRAYFGRKDYQQALIIRRMVRDLDVPVEIRTCPIVREPDGLAMSSRNRYLGPSERSEALALRQAILAADGAFRAGERDPLALTARARAELKRSPGVREDYLELRDPLDLSLRTGPVQTGDLLAVAAFVGKARLIDNGLLGTEVAP